MTEDSLLDVANEISCGVAKKCQFCAFGDGARGSDEAKY